MLLPEGPPKTRAPRESPPLFGQSITLLALVCIGWGHHTGIAMIMGSPPPRNRSGLNRAQVRSGFLVDDEAGLRAWCRKLCRSEAKGGASTWPKGCAQSAQDPADIRTTDRINEIKKSKFHLLPKPFAPDTLALRIREVLYQKATQAVPEAGSGR